MNLKSKEQSQISMIYLWKTQKIVLMLILSLSFYYLDRLWLHLAIAQKVQLLLSQGILHMKLNNSWIHAILNFGNTKFFFLSIVTLYLTKVVLYIKNQPKHLKIHKLVEAAFYAFALSLTYFSFNYFQTLSKFNSYEFHLPVSKVESEVISLVQSSLHKGFISDWNKAYLLPILTLLGTCYSFIFFGMKKSWSLLILNLYVLLSLLTAYRTDFFHLLSLSFIVIPIVIGVTRFTPIYYFSLRALSTLLESVLKIKFNKIRKVWKKNT